MLVLCNGEMVVRNAVFLVEISAIIAPGLFAGIAFVGLVSEEERTPCEVQTQVLDSHRL